MHANNILLRHEQNFEFLLTIITFVSRLYTLHIYQTLIMHEFKILTDFFNKQFRNLLLYIRSCGYFICQVPALYQVTIECDIKTMVL